MRFLSHGTHYTRQKREGACIYGLRPRATTKSKEELELDLTHQTPPLDTATANTGTEFRIDGKGIQGVARLTGSKVGSVHTPRPAQLSFGARNQPWLLRLAPAAGAAGAPTPAAAAAEAGRAAAPAMVRAPG